jgi:3-mercaptopyruvate sulfurtransferase SseA
MNMNTLQAKSSIEPLELQRRLAEGGPAQLLDVRTPGEFAAAHVPGAKLIPLDDLDPAAFRRECGAEGTAGICALPVWRTRPQGD